MARYGDTRIQNSKKNNKNVYTTTIYDKVPERDSDMYFISQHGDRCDSLANRFYGSPTLWWFIARVNHIKGMNIPAGTKLRIPVTTSNAKGS